MTAIVPDHSGKPYRERPAISRHPAFPAIVATWFAVLLGAGSLVLPGVLLERGLEATGIAALFPSTALPLGLTARGQTALVAALAGALAGFAIARRVARAPRHRPLEPSAPFPVDARRPISITEEFGDIDLGSGLANGVGSDHKQSTLEGRPSDCQPGDALGRFERAVPKPATVACLRAETEERGDEQQRPPQPMPFADPRVDRLVDEPSLSQLVARLARAIERRREVSPSTETVSVERDATPLGPGADPTEGAAQRAAARTGAPAPVRTPAAPRPGPRAAIEAMTSHGRHCGVRTELALGGARLPRRPASSPSRAEIDAALRAALAMLQRTSRAS